MVNKLEPDALTPSDGIPGYVLAAAAAGGAGRPRRGTTARSGLPRSVITARRMTRR